MIAPVESTQREEPFGVNLGPDILLPAQLVTGASPTPERRLMVAVLADALRTSQKYAGRHGRCDQPMVAEVEGWFASDDTSWLFSFVSVCERLGLDPGYLRSRLLPNGTGR